MQISTITDSQRKAARIVGFTYLLATVLSSFPEFYVAGQLFVPDSAAETARNIMAHERLFRLGIASNLMTFMLDVVLIIALYVVLEPVNRTLALLAAFWRLIETTILFVAATRDLDILRYLGGAPYLQAFSPEQLQGLARFSLGAFSGTYFIGLAVFGFGSAVFCYLWFRSSYVPRVLAAWGIFASIWVGICSFGFIVFPELMRIVTTAYWAGPIMSFEIIMGLWLLLRDIRRGGAVEVETIPDGVMSAT